MHASSACMAHSAAATGRGLLDDAVDHLAAALQAPISAATWPEDITPSAGRPSTIERCSSIGALAAITVCATLAASSRRPCHSTLQRVAGGHAGLRLPGQRQLQRDAQALERRGLLQHRQVFVGDHALRHAVDQVRDAGSFGVLDFQVALPAWRRARRSRWSSGSACPSRCPARRRPARRPGRGRRRSRRPRPPAPSPRPPPAAAAPWWARCRCGRRPRRPGW
jgi:hypothetical protein